MDKLSLNHYLFTGRTTDGDLPIYLRITYNRKKAEMHSGYSSKLKEWDEASQITKTSKTVNKELMLQKAKALDFMIELNKAQKPVSAAILKDLMTGKNKTDTYLIEYFKRFKDELLVRDEIKPPSLNKYKQSITTLEKFIPSKYSLLDLPIEMVNYEFINAYDLYLKQENKLHKNTINKYHTRLRTIMLRALAEGIINKQPYASFKLVSVKSEREFLQQDELDKLIAHDLSHNKSLDRVKDIFIFSCYTGLRFQDAQNLSTNNLTTFKKKPSIRYTQEKTGNPVDVPLLPIAKKIIDKYKDEPERKILNKLLPKISNQKVNAYLKVIGELAGLQTTITHHMARHTFATTICLNNNMPLEDVSKLLGHSSLKTTAIYGRITQERLQKSMEKIQKKI